MELKDYLKILTKNLWLILLVTILTGGLSYYFGKQAKSVYNGFRTITINKQAAPENQNYYQYDGYYSASAANLQAKSLASWLNSPTTVSLIQEKSGLSSADITDKNLKNLISVKTDPDSSVITVSMSEASSDDLLKKLDTLGEHVKSYFSSLNDSSQFTLQISDSQISEKKPNNSTSVGAGIVAGLVLGMVLAFGREYFSRS